MESIAAGFAKMTTSGNEMSSNPPEWFKPDSIDSQEKVSFHTKWNHIDVLSQHKLFIGLSQTLKENLKLFTELLCSAKYTYADSQCIAESLAAEFEYYATSNIFATRSFVPTTIVTISSFVPVPLLGKYIALSLAFGYNIVLSIPAEHVLTPFYDALERFINSELTCIAVEVNSTKQPNSTSPSICPFVVFDDADIHSAVESALRVSWSYCHEVPWSVTHVLVEESVFQKFANMMKERMKKLTVGPRWSQRIDVAEDQAETNVTRKDNLEVFKPFASCPHKLFIGWDPRETKFEDHDLRYGVSVVPFRTKEEAVSMVNNLLPSFGVVNCASVWTEGLNTSNWLSLSLKVGTIWFNCHGKFHPSVPFRWLWKHDSFSTTAGDALLECLSVFSTPPVPFDSESPTQSSAQKDSDVIQISTWIQNIRTASIQKKFARGSFTVIDKCKVTVETQAIGLILIEADQVPFLKALDYLQAIASYFVSFGNQVVIKIHKNDYDIHHVLNNELITNKVQFVHNTENFSPDLKFCVGSVDMLYNILPAHKILVNWVAMSK